MGVALVVTAAAVAGGAVIFILRCAEAVEDSDMGNRFDGYSLRFHYQDGQQAATWFHTWDSPPNNFELLVTQPGVDWPEPLQDNQQIVTLPPPPNGVFRGFQLL